ncbi:MAG: hypothetical protein M5U34_45725 [Chloroflexi bacterium]|nr:hypothetical protein [Chloroflexota bacterium]
MLNAVGQQIWQVWQMAAIAEIESSLIAQYQLSVQQAKQMSPLFYMN